MEDSYEGQSFEDSVVRFTEEHFDRLFSINLMLIRKSRRMTQAELARRIGTTRNSVVQWESALRHPDVVVIMKIALALEVSIGDLVEESAYGAG